MDIDIAGAWRRLTGAVSDGANSVAQAVASAATEPVPTTPEATAAPAPPQPASAPAQPADNFAACLRVILQSEGGYVVDQGGPTNLGVTIPALEAFLGHPCDASDIRALTPATVGPLYRADYYNAAHCNELAPGLDLMVFDEAVNEGVGRAIRHLQQGLGVTADGLFGSGTRAAAQAMGVVAAIHRLHDANAAYYTSLAPKYPQDERGWHARNDRTRDIALTMVKP